MKNLLHSVQSSFAKASAGYYPPSPRLWRDAIGLLGIEPSLHEPESCVLPVYYSPSRV
jgi:hypothetical protein